MKKFVFSFLFVVGGFCFAACSSTSSSSGSADAVLDDYEDCVEKYIDIVENLKDGDFSATADLAEYLEDVQRLSEETEKVKGEFSSEQLDRFNEITMKMAEAMAKVNK